MADQFEKFAEALKQKPELVNSLSDEKKLEVYALFKQGTVGDCNIAQPGFLDFKGKAKWTAWNEKKGMSPEDARVAYVELL